jgi:hypothetical protein
LAVRYGAEPQFTGLEAWVFIGIQWVCKVLYS